MSRLVGILVALLCCTILLGQIVDAAESDVVESSANRVKQQYGPGNFDSAEAEENSKLINRELLGDTFVIDGQTNLEHFLPIDAGREQDIFGHGEELNQEELDSLEARLSKVTYLPHGSVVTVVLHQYGHNRDLFAGEVAQHLEVRTDAASAGRWVTRNFGVQRVGRRIEVTTQYGDIGEHTLVWAVRQRGTNFQVFHLVGREFTQAQKRIPNK